jgi:hypothetical protein
MTQSSVPPGAAQGAPQAGNTSRPAGAQVVASNIADAAPDVVLLAEKVYRLLLADLSLHARRGSGGRE